MYNCGYAHVHLDADPYANTDVHLDADPYANTDVHIRARRGARPF